MLIMNIIFQYDYCMLKNILLYILEPDKITKITKIM